MGLVIQKFTVRSVALVTVTHALCIPTTEFPHEAWHITPTTATDQCMGIALCKPTGHKVSFAYKHT